MTGRRFAAIAVAAAFTGSVAAATAAETPSFNTTQACLQEIADAEAARTENPEIGDKAKQTFEQLLADARRLCGTREFADADAAINTAKGMVASE